MKAKIRKTGELVDVISYSGSTIRNETVDKISYIDSKGMEHDRETLNFYWDFEVLDFTSNEGKERDWEEVRINAAIIAMHGILSNATMVGGITEIAQRINKDECELLAMSCIGYANTLVEQLKNNKDD